MDEIGLFPLGLVLLPTEQVPLHIFEPRYRELIAECLEADEPFGLVFADDDGLRGVGTLASVVEVTERFEDGRLNVVVEGGDRFRLVELTEGRSFHTGTIEPLGDLEADPPSAEEVERATTVFSRLVQLTGTEVEPPDLNGEQPSFAIAARFELAPDLKLELLEETNERQRLVRLCEILESAAASVERQREIAALAQTNGHAKPADGHRG
ncbi:MAG TPA: LON peptidase substrate-binding domain-containing protein [Gaiella sp.]|nr:LON peptidase substrate-binding domain-containing protein [Gaiella sp.]